jgi:hypothetical protein
MPNLTLTSIKFKTKKLNYASFNSSNEAVCAHLVNY